jgi:spore maturation protein CgeB
MKRTLTFAFFGSSLVSAYWNGAATYYRGILKALAARGHRVTFYEPDAYERQAHRDIEDPPWARVVVYGGDDERDARAALDDAKGCDVLVKASGVGVFDELLEHEVAMRRTGSTRTVFWDVDAPATLARLQSNPDDPLARLVPRFDSVLTYGGGDPVVRGYLAFGARRCVPIYNALDPDTHRPAPTDARFAGDLAFLGNRLPDREARVEEFFFSAARAMPERDFVLGGSGWETCARPANVRYAGHVYTADHNAFNVTPLAVLNVARDSMADVGYSPATRIFEAAGAGACIITDAWEGIELFLEPDAEILLARSGQEVAALLKDLTPDRARAIGGRARARVLAQHTYALRAREVESLFVDDSLPLDLSARV